MLVAVSLHERLEPRRVLYRERLLTEARGEAHAALVLGETGGARLTARAALLRIVRRKSLPVESVALVTDALHDGWS